MKHFNRGTERAQLVDYPALINGLRLPLEDCRLKIVTQAFQKIACDQELSSISVGQAKTAFSYEEFDKWCQAIEVGDADDAQISWNSFRDFYADISMTIFDDKQFVKFVSETWALETSSYNVTPKDIEHMVAAIRHNLLKYGNARRTEEYILRELYREFDVNNNGTLSISELSSMLTKINIKTEDRFLQVLFNKFDANDNGQIEFEEFVSYVIHERYHKY